MLFAQSLHAPQSASSAIIDLVIRMESAGHRMDEATGFCADIGPGSFTGVRVGVVMAKTFGMVYGRPCAGATSFDLISANETVCVPCKRNEVFVRVSGHPPETFAVPLLQTVKGYGVGGDDQFPSASQFGAILTQLEFSDALNLLPEYLHEPSISTPKRPYGGALAK